MCSILPGWLIGTEVRVGDRSSIADGQHLASGWVAGGEQAEDDVVVHIPQGVDGGILLVQVGQVHVAVTVSDQVPLGHELGSKFIIGELGRVLVLGMLQGELVLGMLRGEFVLPGDVLLTPPLLTDQR